jgi:hypothetical protein
VCAPRKVNPPHRFLCREFFSRGLSASRIVKIAPCRGESAVCNGDAKLPLPFQRRNCSLQPPPDPSRVWDCHCLKQYGTSGPCTFDRLKPWFPPVVVPDLAGEAPAHCYDTTWIPILWRLGGWSVFLCSSGRLSRLLFLVGFCIRVQFPAWFSLGSRFGTTFCIFSMKSEPLF